MIPELLVSIEGDIGYLALNRPESHNAINLSMWKTLPLVLEQLRAQVRVIVITGQGDSFAAGADLLELEKLQSYADSETNWKAIADCLEYLWQYPLPTIAMINGACIGGGCLLALACDLRYAALPAIFGVPICKLGIVLDDANISRLVNLVGSGYARELLYTGDTISSAHADSIGLVNGVCQPDALKARVQLVAGAIAKNVSTSVEQSKRSINRACSSDPLQVQDRNLIIESYLQPEFRQRLSSHLSRKR